MSERENYRTVHVTDEQAKFLDENPQLNFSAITRQALDAYRERFEDNVSLRVMTEQQMDQDSVSENALITEITTHEDQ